MRTLFSLLFFCFANLSCSSFAQTVLWTKSYNSTRQANVIPIAQVVDSSGNAYVLSSSHDTTTTYKVSGATGKVVWSSTYTGSPGNGGRSNAIAIDRSGNIIVTGQGGNRTIRTIKYDGASGAQMWIANYVSSNPFNGAEGLAIAVDLQNNVVVTGTSNELPAGGGTQPSGSRTIKYNGADGAQIWSVGQPRGRNVAVAVDAQGDVFVTGTRDSDGVIAQSMRTTKYAGQNGAELWTAIYRGSYPSPVFGDRAIALAVDASGAVTVTGESMELQGSEGAQYMLTIKYDGITGQGIWIAGYRGGEATAMAIGANGDIFVSSVVGETALVNGSTTSVIRARTIKYSKTTGAIVWTAAQDGFNPRGHALAVDNAGNVVASIKDIDVQRAVKYDGNTGAAIWSTAYASGAQPEPHLSLSIDYAGNVITSGTDRPESGSFGRTIKYSGVTGQQVWSISSRVTVPAEILSFGKRPIAAAAVGDLVVAGIVENYPVTYFGQLAKFSSSDGAVVWESNVDFHPYAVALDSLGDVIVTGSGIGVQGKLAICTAKFARATGEQIWRKDSFYGESYLDTGYALAIDPENHAVVTGFGGSGQNMRTIKYHGATGAELWNASSGQTGKGNAIAIDLNADVFVTGSSFDQVGAQNIRTIKYDGKSGRQLWTSSYNGNANNYDGANAIVVTPVGDVVVTGFSVDQGEYMRTIKYDGASGLEIWNVGYPGGYSPAGNDTAIDSRGDVVMTGISGGGGPQRMRTVKYDGGSGVEVWNSFFDNRATNARDEGRAVRANVNGNVIVIGTSRDDNGIADIRTIKYNGITGVELWNLPYRGSSGDNDFGHAVAIGAAGTIYTLGTSYELGKPSGWLLQKIQDIIPDPSTVSVTTNSNRVDVGQRVTFTASILGKSPTGQVKFFVDGKPIYGCEAALLVAAQASCTTSFSVAGRKNISVQYGGDNANLTSTSILSGGQTVGPVTGGRCPV